MSLVLILVILVAVGLVLWYVMSKKKGGAQKPMGGSPLPPQTPSV